MDLVLYGPIAVSILAVGGALYAAAAARTAIRERARLARTLDRVRSADVCQIARSPTGRLAVAVRLLTHVEASLALPQVAEERDAVLFGLRWAANALDDAELLAVEERARLDAARTRLHELRIKAETAPAETTPVASTRRSRR